MPKQWLKRDIHGKFDHSIDDQVNGFTVTLLHSCLANPAESPVCVIAIKPEYSESVRAALEKDKIGFHTKCVLWFYFDIS
jgi:hypothetical protein